MSITHPHPGYLRIATEEAWAPAEMLPLWQKVLDSANPDPGFVSLIGFYMNSQSARAQHVKACLQDLGALRLRHMDEAGIDHQVIALTSPGVQVLEKAEAVAFASVANDQLADAVRRHPTRFSGMIAVAPQDPQAAAREIERGAALGLKGVIINSHTQGEYLSDQKFWPIFEAAEAVGAPIYLHPNTSPRNMIQPFLEAGLDGAVFGFGVETGLHALRIITAGVFDRFPRLQMILGHMGEALPFWAYRLDYMHGATVRSQRYEVLQPLEHKISDYLQRNFYITSSGMAWEKAIRFTQDVVGMDRVMYAMDYPYQHAPEEVLAMDAMDWPPQHKRQFFQDNAIRAFGLNFS